MRAVRSHKRSAYRISFKSVPRSAASFVVTSLIQALGAMSVRDFARVAAYASEAHALLVVACVVATVEVQP